MYIPISVKKELANYLIEKIEDGTLTDENIEDWHFYAFRSDYYIITYYEASKWLKKHNIDAFDAIQYVEDYEIEMCGKLITALNSEAIVNAFVSIAGEELIYNNYTTVSDQKKEMEKIIEELK